MSYAICLGLFLPLAGFLILLLTSSRISRTTAGFVGCGSIFLAFICFAGLLYAYTTQNMAPHTVTLYQWIPISHIHADFALRLDSLSLVMTMIITGVGFLIHLYSNGYMEHDEDYARYFACMNFFVFMMLLLVLASNLILLFVGWEGVGLASYLLIGFDYHRPSAAQAATKAFVVNRIGDAGFLLGLLLIFHTFGTSDIDTIVKGAGERFGLESPLLGMVTFLLFIGATGKSAQLPLHTWLPDAMEGPTPVSALIHAATMVTAGVYLVVRMHAVFMLTPTTLHYIGAIGAVTSLFAALCAVGQMDLKKVLAYSTVSQLGLMFLACGVGAFYAAMFHLTTHAFMKSLLFLSAGNVVHMMRGVTDMGKMGGLAKNFPVTHWMFLIGTLAMSGIPPLSAFFSKDLILEQSYIAGFEALFYIGLAASILTAFYLMRAYCLTFWGTPHLDAKIRKSTHEAPVIMVGPVSVLAILATFGGLLGHLLAGFLEKVGVTLAMPEPEGGMLAQPETWMSIFGAFLGMLTAILMYIKYYERLGSPIMVLRESFYIDAIYNTYVVRPLQVISKAIAHVIEPIAFDGSIHVAVTGTQQTARWLQKLQNGQIRSYVAWMIIGTVVLVVYFVV